MGEHKWIGSSLRHLSAELKDMDHAASRMTVGRLLRKPDYSLKSNVKRLSVPAHPDRGHQFEYIEAHKQAYLEADLPVISVDGKKK